MVMVMELVFGHVPVVVCVTVYEPSALALRSMRPVDVFRNTSPAGVALNVPAVTTDVAVGSAPVWQYVDDP